jgi:DNA repair protein SbcC/Rad50
MKILSISLKNINSLRGEHRVYFDRFPFRDAGLFGIVGAMGSGKSTLLDCITLALYNHVPRYGQVSKPLLEKGNVILTSPEKDCFAEVRYESREGIFTARWSVGKTKNDTFRNVEMAVYNEAGQMIDSGLSVAPALNARNIGLDYDQFVRSILLCQGDFARFLQSDRDQRAELLEKITGTGSFRKIGKRAFLAHNKRKREIDVLTETIDAFSRSRLSTQDR